jgi:hypothetical protein
MRASDRLQRSGINAFPFLFFYIYDQMPLLSSGLFW